MTQLVPRPSPDGVPVLEVVSRGIPGEAGDRALAQGRLDARHGVYRPQLAGSLRGVYEQGQREVLGAAASRKRRRNPAFAWQPSGWGTGNYNATFASPNAVVNQSSLPNMAPLPNPAPPLPPGVPVYGPAVPPGVLGLGQGCYTNYDCAPGEYCHSGTCFPDVWSGGYHGRGAGAQQVESVGGRPTRFNPRFNPPTTSPGYGPRCNWHPCTGNFRNVGGWRPRLAAPEFYPQGTGGWSRPHQMFPSSMLGPLRTPARNPGPPNPGVGPTGLALAATGHVPRANGPRRARNPGTMKCSQRPLAPPDLIRRLR